MAQPIDYSLNVETPTQALQGGYKQGIDEAAIAARQQALQMQAMQQQQQLLMEQQRQEAYSKLSSPGVTPQDFQRAILLSNPEMAKVIQQSMASQTEQENRAAISKLAPVALSLLGGKPQVAIKNLRNQLLAFEGNQAAQDEIKAQIASIEQDPEAATHHMAGVLSVIPGGEKVLEQALKLTQEQRASKAEERAQSQELRAAEMQGWNIKKIQSEMQIAKINSQIAAASAAASQESNALKRDELRLKVEELQEKRDAAIKDKIAEGESAYQSLRNTKALIKDLQSDEDTLRAAVGTSAWRAAIPGTKAKTVAGKIEQLQNAVAAANLDKIKGAMSDKDLIFLKNIESNLNRYQNEDAFIAELKRVSKNVDFAIERVAKKYGIPDQDKEKAEREKPSAASQPKPKSRNVTVDY